MIIMLEIFPENFEIRNCEYGVGVFALEKLPGGAFLRLCPRGFKLLPMPKHEVPIEYLKYCIARPYGILLCPWEETVPEDPQALPLDSYLNHSHDPNTKVRITSGGICTYMTRRVVMPDEQVLIDYNQFGEPVEDREPYYFRPKELVA